MCRHDFLISHVPLFKIPTFYSMADQTILVYITDFFKDTLL